MGNENQSFLPELSDQEGPQPGPSWGNPCWLDAVSGSDGDLTAALDPTQMRLAVEQAAKKAGKAADPRAIEEAAADSIRAMMLVRTYRVRGHLAADLDPLGLSKQDLPADLDPEYHGFSGAALDRPVYLGGTLGMEWGTVRELVDILRRNYCGKIGFEYMHIADVEERRFIQDRIEGGDKSIDFTPEGKKAILAAVIRGEQYEKFLGKKY
ncbi:MAG: 2-oxoglutarate dehydrogenase E1 component, partial [Sphingomonadaceae bacterium]|nr:2-oxoglutarate dehydrogenase E1 component [Sphingomonadaceae bacterium]